MKYIFSSILILHSFVSFSQTQALEAIKRSHECDDELSTLQSELNQLSEDYKKIVDDLNQGLFCSKCSRSKTEIGKTGEEFYKHVNRVEGTVEKAPVEMFERARKEYDKNYNNTLQDIESKRKQCDDLKSEYMRINSESIQQAQVKQHQEMEARYQAIINSLNERSKAVKEQSQRFSEAMNSILERLKEVTSKKMEVIAAKSERFWDENKEDISELVKGEAMETINEIGEEVESTGKQALKTLGATNQTLSNVQTVDEIGNRSLGLFEKTGDAAKNITSDESEKTAEALEKNFNSFGPDVAKEIMKTPYPIRRMVDFVEGKKELVYDAQRKLLLIKKIGTSAVKIYIFNE